MLRRTALGVATGIVASTAGCTDRSAGSDSEPGTAGEALSVAVTTSTYDAGVLDPLHRAFEDRFGVRVRTISQGTGENVRTGERGDADVIMVHAPELEATFRDSGHGINRRDFVLGDFVVVGPADDPAGIEGIESAAEAFATIADEEASFASRGDDSGTHVKKRAVWNEAGTDPGGEWYLETGQGMGETLVQADRQGAYLLSVRGTYIDARDGLSSEPFVEGPVTGGDPLLDNPYGLFVVNPAIHERVEYDLAMAYVGFLTGPEGQRIVGEYRAGGERLFVPDALSEEPNLAQYCGAGADQ
jgi:tungstate transport system substrate-binding protein